VVVDAAGRDANVIFGAVIDESMGDALSITVIATGFGKGDARKQMVESPRPALSPRIVEMERVARQPVVVRHTLDDEDLELAEPQVQEAAPVQAPRPSFRMAPGTARRPFGGRALTKDNMDVPAFMRKQMD